MTPSGHLGDNPAHQRRRWGFDLSGKYNITRPVHVETYADPTSAIAREKQIKGWSRAKKLALIETDNPDRRDLSDGWFDESLSFPAPLLPVIPPHMSFRARRRGM